MTIMTNATQDNMTAYPSHEVLAMLKQIAETEGRQVQALLDEALREYIQRKTLGHPNPQVMAAFAESVAEFDSLYTELAK